MKDIQISSKYKSGIKMNVNDLTFINRDTCAVKIDITTGCSYHKNIVLIFKPEKVNVHSSLGLTIDSEEAIIKYVATSKLSAKQEHWQISRYGFECISKLNATGIYVLTEYIQPNMNYADPIIEVAKDLDSSELRKFNRGILSLTNNNLLERVDTSHSRRYYINFQHFRKGSIIAYLANLAGERNLKKFITESIIESYNSNELINKNI